MYKFNIVNDHFIRKLSLKRVTFFGLLLWLIIYFFSNVEIIHGINFMGLLYIAICYIALFAGFLHSNDKIKAKNYIVISKSLKTILYISLCIAVIAFLFKVFDKFFIRGISLNNNTIENREILTENSSTIFGVLGAILTPFAFVPLFIYYVINKKNIWLFSICLLVFLSTIFENVLLGARFGILMTLILLALYIFHFKNIKVNRKMKFAIILVLLAFSLVATKMFLERTKEFAVTDKVAINHILTNAGYNYTIKPTNEYKEEIINSNNKIIKLAKLAKMNLSQYYIHGVFEFNYLYSNYDKPHQYGAYMFSIVPKFSNILFGTSIDLEEISDSMTRKGVYTTFFGPLFVDFGWLGPVFMFCFGLFQSVVYNKVLNKNFKYLPLLFFFYIIDFFIPVINFIVSAQGLYIIIAFITFIAYYKLLVFRKVIKENKLTLKNS